MESYGARTHRALARITSLLRTPCHPGSGKQPTARRENHRALHDNGRFRDGHVTGIGRVRDVGLRGQYARLASSIPGDQADLP